MSNSEQWLAFLANNAVKATLVLIAAHALAFGLRRASAAARNLAWTWTILCLLVLPVLSLLLPAWHVGLAAETQAASLEKPADAAIERTAAPVRHISDSRISRSSTSSFCL